MHTQGQIDADLREVMNKVRENGFKDGHWEALMQVHNMLVREGYDVSATGSLGRALRNLAESLGTPINENGEPVTEAE